MLNNRSIFLLFLFTSSFIKSLFISPTYVDSVILLILGVVFCYSEYKNNDARTTKIEKLLEEQAKELADHKDKLTSIKIVQQVKPSSIAFRA